MSTKTFACPSCKKTVTEWPATSRLDDKTEICSDCGNKEAISGFRRVPQPQRVTAFLNPHLVARAKAQAANEGISFSKIVTKALQKYTESDGVDLMNAIRMHLTNRKTALDFHRDVLRFNFDIGNDNSWQEIDGVEQHSIEELVAIINNAYLRKTTGQVAKDF